MEIFNSAEAQYVLNGNPDETISSNSHSIELRNSEGLILTKSASHIEFLAGDIIDYTITITNTSQFYLNGVRIIDNLGGGNLAYVLSSANLTVGSLTYNVQPISTNPLTFTLQELAVGQSMTLRYKAQVVFNLPASVNSITNSVQGIGYTSNGTINGFANLTIQKKTNNLFSLVKSSSSDSVLPNELFEYILSFINDTQTNAVVTIVTDQLPANFEVTSVWLQVGAGMRIQLTESQYSISSGNLLTISSQIGNEVLVPANTATRIFINGYFN